MNKETQEQLASAPGAVATSTEQEVLAQWGFSSLARASYQRGDFQHTTMRKTLNSTIKTTKRSNLSCL